MRYSLIILMFLSAMSAITAWPQAKTQTRSEAKDTVVRELKELIVEGRTQKIIDEGVSYIPDKKSKKFAMDAIDLLMNMAIPQLLISNDKSVKTATGQSVSIFIDYVEADAASIEGIRTEDVVRVEVLDYPSDVRFHQSEHVVNFIMRKYEWGGYTKLTADGRFMNNENVHGSLYSKFSYRNWTFDVHGTGEGTWAHRNRERTQETFRDFGYESEHYTALTRMSETDRFKSRANKQNAGLRAVYQKGNAFILHTLTFQRDAEPFRNSHEAVEFSDMHFPTSQSTMDRNNRGLHAWITGDYYFRLPLDNSLAIQWQMGYNGHHGDSRYILGDMEPIKNREKTNFYCPYVKVSHSKKLGGGMLTSTLSTYDYFHDGVYRGSTETSNRIFNSVTEILVSYRKGWNFGLNVAAWAAARYNFMREDGKDYLHKWTPFLRMRLDYMPNRKNRIFLNGMWRNDIILPEKTADVLRRQDELLWTQGNPGLRPGDLKSISLSYAFIPTNVFSLMAHVLYYDNNHVPVYDYHIRDGYDGLIRTYSDDNREREVELALSGSLRLFNRSLVLNGNICMDHQWNRGVMKTDNTCVFGGANARWSHRNFSVGLYYFSPFKTIFQQQGYRVRVPCSYGANLTYAIKEFKATVKFENWFTQGNVHRWFESELYSYDGRIWARGNSRFLQLTLSYTFPYGKHIDRNDEFDAEDGPKLGL